MSLSKLNGMLSACKGGERLDLAGLTMEKGTFSLPKSLSAPVTLVGGTWNGFNISGLHDLIFEKPTMNCDPADKICYRINNAKKVFIKNPHVTGDPAIPLSQLNNTAIHWDACAEVGIDGGIVEFVRYGVSFYRDCQKFHAMNTEYRFIRTDAIRGEGGDGATIANNNIHDFSPPSIGGATGDHPDAIQFWTGIDRPKQPPRNFAVFGNRIWRGNGKPFQGIFFRSYWGTDVSNGLPMEKRREEPRNIGIFDNDIAGGLYNGIVLFGTGTVTNNAVMGVGNAKEKSWIRVTGRSQGQPAPVTVKSNFAALIFVEGTLDPSNTILPFAKDLMEAMAVMLLNDNGLPPDVPPDQTPTDPTPIPDDPIPAPDPDPEDPHGDDDDQPDPHDPDPDDDDDDDKPDDDKPDDDDDDDGPAKPDDDDDDGPAKPDDDDPPKGDDDDGQDGFPADMAQALQGLRDAAVAAAQANIKLAEAALAVKDLIEDD